MGNDFRLHPDWDVAGVAAGQLEEISTAIDATDTHRLRKAVKRLRALLVLVAADTGKKRVRKDDRLLRDLARGAASARDAAVLRQLFDELAAHLEAPIEEIEAARSSLRAHAEQAAPLDPDTARKRLERIRKRSARWAVTPEGAARGAARTLKRSRKRMRQAERTRDPQVLHEWRKAVKHHWHHVELLGDQGRAEEVHIVADRLGDDHDLVVLAEHLPDLPTLAPVLAERQGALREEAFDRGELLFGGPPELAANQLVAGQPVP